MTPAAQSSLTMGCMPPSSCSPGSYRGQGLTQNFPWFLRARCLQACVSGCHGWDRGMHDAPCPQRSGVTQSGRLPVPRLGVTRGVCQRTPLGWAPVGPVILENQLLGTPSPPHWGHRLLLAVPGVWGRHASQIDRLLASSCFSPETSDFSPVPEALGSPGPVQVTLYPAVVSITK